VPRTALLWGIAAFAATSLAPALGLSPELPGSAGAPLLSRQIWWVATALCTGGGIFLLARIEYTTAKIVGVVLILAPHIIGAPHTPKFKSTAPAELAAQFAATSLVVSAVLWALLGLAVGYAWQRVSRSQHAPVPA
jgi:cobalt transporter subunit CbtA